MTDISISELRRIRIEALELYAGVQPVEAYMQLSNDKFVKIKNKDEPNVEMLARYHKKGVAHVFLPIADFDLFASNVREYLSKRLKKIEEEKVESDTEEQVLEKKVQALNSAQEVLKTIMNSGKINEESKRLAYEIADKMFDMVTRTNIAKYFNVFKKNCSEEFTHSTLVSFVTCAMVDNFSWGNEEIKKKITLAALFSDMTLTPEDFVILRKYKGDKESLTPKVLNHPLEISEIIEKESNFVSSETLTIIKQHHERPGGKGFPKGLNHQSITALTAVYIVGHYYVERMFNENYSEEYQIEKMKNVVDHMKEKFSLGVFKKAWESLHKIFG